MKAEPPQRETAQRDPASETPGRPSARDRVDQDIRFSVFPMLALLGIRDFREKFWCVNDETGLCQGVHAWQTLGGATRCPQSIAMRFMRNRSDPDSVGFEIIDQRDQRHWLFERSRQGAHP